MSIGGWLAWNLPPQSPPSQRKTIHHNPAQKRKKPAKKRASDVPCLPVIGQGITPTGIEQSADLRGNRGSVENVPLSVPPSLAGKAENLLAIWLTLDDAGREDLLAVARGLAAVQRDLGSIPRCGTLDAEGD